MTTEVAPASVALRQATTATAPLLYGYFAPFNQWTEIHSLYEGHFLERFAPGSFATTIREDRDRIRILFQHGRDEQVGEKPLGKLLELREDNGGAYYEVELYPNIPGLLMDGLRDGAYDASFRFSALREDIDHHHTASGLPSLGPATAPQLPAMLARRQRSTRPAPADARQHPHARADAASAKPPLASALGAASPDGQRVDSAPAIRFTPGAGSDLRDFGRRRPLSPQVFLSPCL
jgi:HK97 family phage prohead protease